MSPSIQLSAKAAKSYEDFRRIGKMMQHVQWLDNEVNRLREQLDHFDSPLFLPDETHLEDLCEEKAVAQKSLQEHEENMREFIRLHKPPNVFIGGWWFDMERRFADVAEPYAQEVCRHLVEEFRTRLPRELRDRVYDYLVQGSIDQQFEVSIRDTQTGGLPSKIHSFAIDPTYVGQQVAIEIAELCYRRHVHQTCIDVERLKYFLRADPFELRLPVGEYVHKLAICWSKKNRGVRVPKDSEEIVQKALKWIKLLPEAEGVAIQNTIRQRIKPIWDLKGLVGVLERLRPVYNCLKEKQVSAVFVEYFPFGPVDYTTYYTSSSFETWCVYMEHQKATMEKEVEERQAKYEILSAMDEPVYEL